MDAGIPVVTVDSDVPTSKRLCFVGQDWYYVGVEMIKSIAPLIGDKKGKIAGIAIPGHPNSERWMVGVKDTVKQLIPNCEVIDSIYASQSNPQKVAELTSNLIATVPDLVAVLGGDSSGGPGIAQALKETGKVGQVFSACADTEMEHLQCVKEGTMACAVGQLRKLYTYYGVKMLYDYNHSKVDCTGVDKELGFSNIPIRVVTGVYVANKDNVDKLIEAKQNSAK
jgi:ABC-type sugar transport system substrate-binding protein